MWDYSYPSEYACPTSQHLHQQCSTMASGTDTVTGSADAPVTVNDTDYYVIATPVGY